MITQPSAIGRVRRCSARALWRARTAVLTVPMVCVRRERRARLCWWTIKNKMKILKIAALPAALATGALALFAQWPEHSTPGPRTKEGKIDLAAPPPRTADGKPDFSGLWEPARGPGGRGGINFNGTPPLPFAIPTSPDDPPVAQFFNIGAGLKEGLPFTPWAKELRAQRTANNNKDNPDALCLPLGLTQLHMHPQPRKIVQTQREIVVLYEANGNTRQILTDGRRLPSNEATPWWYGYSAGHWEGDTLVVETTGFRDDVWLDVEGSPLTVSSSSRNPRPRALPRASTCDTS